MRRDHDRMAEDMLLGNRIAAGDSTALVHREVLQDVGGFDAALSNGEDWGLWLRVAEHFRIANLDEPLYLLRIHSDGVSVRQLERQLACVESARRCALQRREHGADSIGRSLPCGDDTWLPNASSDRLFYRLLSVATSYYGLGLVDVAETLVMRAQRASPQTYSEGSEVEQWITRTAASLRSGDHLVSAEEYIAWVMGLLGLERRVRRAKSMLHMSAVFEAHVRKDRRSVRCHLIRGVRRRPRWLLNLGVWSIGIEAFLGARVAQWTRSKARGLRSE